MSQIHYQRLAWDSARTVVASIEANYWPWLGYQLGERIEPDLRERVIDSFARLNGHPERFCSEVGIWRATFTELLTDRPTAADGLSVLMGEARNQMSLVAA